MDGIAYALLQTGGIFGRLLRRFGNLIGEVVYGASEVLPISTTPQVPQTPPPEPVSSWLPQVLNPIYIALIVAVVAIVTTFVLRFYVAKRALSGKIAFSYEPSYEKPYEKPKKEEKRPVQGEKRSFLESLRGRSEKKEKEKDKEKEKGKGEEQPAKKASTKKTPKKETVEDLLAPITEESVSAPSIEEITREEFEERLPDIKEYAKEIAKEEMRKTLNASNEEEGYPEGSEEEEEEEEEGEEEEFEGESEEPQESKRPWE